ncbi:MAG: GrlR family regulatory protein [Nitrospinota bacterium]
MFDGLWTVEFVSTINRYGKGVLVINGSRLLGGDNGYYYSGTCKISNNNFEAKITVIKYDTGSISVFGNIDHFELMLNGKIDENRFDAIATIANNEKAKMSVVGTKKEDLQP